MSPAHVLEPTYDRLKTSLMEGLWLPGAKLEAMRLADDFGVSMTPVRDSLNRLVGEGLVEMQPGEGYRAAQVSERRLRELLDLTDILISACQGSDPTTFADLGHTSPKAAYADRVAWVISGVAAGCENMSLIDMLRSINERIHSLRSVEPDVIPDAVAEVRELEYLLGVRDAHLLPRVQSYLRRRREAAEALVFAAGKTAKA